MAAVYLFIYFKICTWSDIWNVSYIETAMIIAYKICTYRKYTGVEQKDTSSPTRINHLPNPINLETVKYK